MKRKSWIYVLSSLCILIGTFCLSGCGNSEQEEPVAENTIITRQTVQEEKAKKVFENERHLLLKVIE